jgi:predicted regulator of Ras-like GTPase activity (Roadblock/LC7/MglB family)
MSVSDRVTELGSIDGVNEATLCGADGEFVSSSATQPRLGIVAGELRQVMLGIQGVIPDLRAPLNVTVEGDHGALHLAATPRSILILSTTNDANLGAVRMEMREALSEPE